MRVLLIAVNTSTTPYPVFPLGASVIAKALKNAGHKVELLDLLAALPDEKIDSPSLEPVDLPYADIIMRETIDAFAPDCIGISLRNIESTESSTSESSWSLDRLKSMVEFLRRGADESMPGKDVPISIGGPGFTIMPAVIFEHIGADFGVIGAGERIYPQLLARMTTGEKLYGLFKDEVEEAPCIGGADYGPLAERYHNIGGLVGIQSRRGCSFNCIYCCYPLLEGRKVHPRPVEEVAEEIRRFRQDYGFRMFSFSDALFNDAKGYWRELVEELARRELGINWTAFMHPHGINRDDLKMLKKSGCMAMEFGTDAASDATLAGIRKPFRMGEVIELQEWCVGAGIPSSHYVIFGGPGETAATVEEGLANLDRLNGSVVLACSGLSIHPGTALHELALREGVLSPDDTLLHPRYYYAPGLDYKAMEKRIARDFKRRKDRIYPTTAMDARLNMMRRMGYRGVLWDYLLPEVAKRRVKAL